MIKTPEVTRKSVIQVIRVNRILVQVCTRVRVCARVSLLSSTRARTDGESGTRVGEEVVTQK